jgi:hypothetical protein
MTHTHSTAWIDATDVFGITNRHHPECKTVGGHFPHDVSVCGMPTTMCDDFGSAEEAHEDWCGRREAFVEGI